MIKNKIFLIKFFFILLLIIICILPTITISDNFFNEEKIKHDLKYIQQLDNTNANQKIIIDSLQSALNFIEEKKISDRKIAEYQEIMDNFSYIALQLQEEYNKYEDICSSDTYQNCSIDDLKKKLFQVHHELRNISNQLKQEKNYIQSIHESLRSLPQQQTALKNVLTNLEKQKKIYFSNIKTPLEYAKFTAFRAKQSANRLKIVELELAQLSASNRKELSKLKIALLKKKYNYTNNKLQILKNKINSLHHEELNQEINNIKTTLSQQNNVLLKSIQKQLQINQNLLLIITQQTHYIQNIELKKNEIDSYIIQAYQTYADLIEQSQWVNQSPALGETLRFQVSKLPKIPKFQQLNYEMAQLRTKRLQYENHMHKLSLYILHVKHNDNSILTLPQKNILEKQLHIQHKLMVLLLNNYDTQILELTKLKISYEQLKNALQEVQQATHCYLFWVADLHPVTISYFLDIFKDIRRLFIDQTFHNQIISALHIFYHNKNTLILIIFFTIILIRLYWSIHHHYYDFLERSSKYIGKVNQDNFLITFYNICSSMIIAMPVPLLWMVIGYNLSHAWTYPIIISIGEGIISTVLILWIFILSSYFASSKGLFIMHFGWSKKRIRQVFSGNYVWSTIIIVLLTTALTIFNNYNHREFSNTLGRLCFIILCMYLTFMTNKLKRSRFPLYLNKNDSSNNTINHILWNIMICAPIGAAIACSFGYLFAAQVLLTRLEISLFIWALLLIIYYIIRRWMLIQRRRIAFKRAKKKRAAQLVLRASNELLSYQQSTQKMQFISNENDKKNLDLDTISNKSLQLIRSIITLIALLLMTFLWSGLNSAFSFLENITLWDLTSTITGVENIQPITLKTCLTIIVVIIITTIMVRHLPAFLELTLLQHLHLTPGTGYAITTLTKYILMFFSSLIGLSLTGIEWVKIQWLIAALGVGLGFGLQEIFANFISGLMILFEKPIRIGDTVTIQNITGHITRINTRATIITDWDYKEIIIPNKEFITKKFTNWSLSNTITRVILRIPAPFQINIKEMTTILMKIIQSSPFSLDKPSSEVYLISLTQGIPIFEIRTYTSNIKHRIPLCHEINVGVIEYCKNHQIKMPYIPFGCYTESIKNNNTTQSAIIDFTKSVN